LSSAATPSDNPNTTTNTNSSENNNNPTIDPQASINNAPAPEPVAETTSFTEYFDKMIQKYGEDYMKRVVEMAKQQKYTIQLRKPTGKKIPDPLEPEKQMDEYSGMEPKDYTRQPISAEDYHRAEKLRAKFQNEKDPDKVADNQARIYQFLAYCYLGMAYSEFARVADWTEIKLVIDACNHKTLYQPG
jgi:hypothetical protein